MRLEMTITPLRWPALLLSLLVVLTTAPAFGQDNLDPMPPWNFAEITDRAIDGWDFKAEEVKAFHLLAWNRVVNRRGQTDDNVLLWVQLHVGHPEQLYMHKPDLWALMSMSRREGEDKTWRENARIGPHELPGIRIFESAPSNEDVYRFLGTAWDFSSGEHFRLLDGAVRQHTWAKVIGEKPTKFHQNEYGAQR